MQKKFVNICIAALISITLTACGGRAASMKASAATTSFLSSSSSSSPTPAAASTTSATSSSSTASANSGTTTSSTPTTTANSTAATAASSSGTQAAAPSSGSSSGSTPAAAISASGPYGQDFYAVSNWLASQVAPSGALLYGSSQIEPYYANLAATGMVKDPARYVEVENWMRWYVAHLNQSDRWGLGGTMYDYNVDGSGNEVSTNTADSTDSYAATFLSLAYAYYATGNPAAQSYVRSIASQLDHVGQVIAKTQQSDGLTWSKPDYQIKYLMDNSEVYRGLADAATLFGAIGDGSKQGYYAGLATKCQNGLLSMWMGNTWAVYKDAIGRLAAPNLGTWYADATAQLFPVLYGVVPGPDSRAQKAYASFNQAWSGWPQLSFLGQDSFPWVMIADAAAMMGDTSRVNAYAATARGRWINAGFPWTWYNMEAGWYMRLAAFMQGSRPL